AGVQGAATDRGAQAHVVVVGLEVVAQASALEAADVITSSSTPAQLAVTVLTVGQGQLHDFEVVGSVDGPVGDRVIVPSLTATIVAGAGADRAVGVRHTQGRARCALAGSVGNCRDAGDRTIGIRGHGVR